jgi:hypothetical protein
MASARMQLLSKNTAVEGDLILLDGSVTVFNPSKTIQTQCNYAHLTLSTYSLHLCQM